MPTPATTPSVPAAASIRSLPRGPSGWAILGIAAAIAALATPHRAHAQAAQAYENVMLGDRDGLNEAAAPCDTPLIRRFAVNDRFIVADVDIGVLLQHSYRADIRMTLQSPRGTRVIFNSGVGGGADNYNVVADDEARAALSTHTGNDVANDASSAPPYQHHFRPSAPLAAFDGEDAGGAWLLELCDTGKGDSGTFYRADLYLTSAPERYSDLSLVKTVSDPAPRAGATISYTLTVTNAGASPAVAEEVTVRDTLPAGVSYTGASGTGSYDSRSGVWRVGTVEPGQSVSITLSVSVIADAGATVANRAEIASSSVADLDSVPNDNSETQDDDDQVSFMVAGTRAAGVAPVLTCPVGTTVFDWDSGSVVWPAGSTVNSFAVASIGTTGWAITLDGAWLNNAAYGGQSPAEQTTVTGGLPAGQQSLFLYPDFATISQISVITLALPTPVPALQFTIFDVDYNAGQFADRIAVTGAYNGASVTPILTNGTANYVIGNSAYGDIISADTSAAGNVTVTFTQPVDTVTIDYGNHALAPADPGGQAIAVADIIFCRPQAIVSIDKSSEVISDPVNGTGTDRKALPGAIVSYCLLIGNMGSGHATGVTISDALPPTLAYVAGSMRSGATCATATAAEDDDATGADESDPLGAAITSTTSGTTTGMMTVTTISAAIPRLTTAQTVAIRFNATVN